MCGKATLSGGRSAGVVEECGDSRTAAENDSRNEHEPGEIEYGGWQQRRRDSQVIGVHAQHTLKMLSGSLCRFQFMNMRRANETAVQQANNHYQGERPGA